MACLLCFSVTTWQRANVLFKSSAVNHRVLGHLFYSLHHSHSLLSYFSLSKFNLYYHAEIISWALLYPLCERPRWALKIILLFVWIRYDQWRYNKLSAYFEKDTMPWLLQKIGISTLAPSIAININVTSSIVLQNVPPRKHSRMNTLRRDHFIHLQHLCSRFRLANMTCWSEYHSLICYNFKSKNSSSMCSKIIV